MRHISLYVFIVCIYVYYVVSMFSKWCDLATCRARLLTLPAKRCTYSRGLTWQRLVPSGVTASDLSCVV